MARTSPFKQSPSSETDSPSASQVYPHSVREPESLLWYTQDPSA
jgi:hypothetical protein